MRFLTVPLSSSSRSMLARPLVVALAAWASLFAIMPGADAQALEKTVAVPDSESKTLHERLNGTLILARPDGGISAISLASLKSRDLRPAKQGHAAIHQLSGPDQKGQLIFVDDGGAASRIYRVFKLDGGKEKKLFTGEGDPTWDDAISPPSLAPNGALIAYVAQIAGQPIRRYTPLRAGPLRLWDVAADNGEGQGQGKGRDLNVFAGAERPSWFPDAQRLAYTVESPSAGNQPSVHLIDIRSGENTRFTEGRLPLVSSDGKTVLVMRGLALDMVLVDAQTREEQKIPRRHGIDTPIALFDSRYLIYRGAMTAGHPASGIDKGSGSGSAAATATSTSVQPIMMMDIKTGEFTTLVAQIDSRAAVAATSGAAIGQKK